MTANPNLRDQIVLKGQCVWLVGIDGGSGSGDDGRLIDRSPHTQTDGVLVPLDPEQQAEAKTGA